MSASERQARADEANQLYAETTTPTQNRTMLVQMSQDALTDMQSAPVQRLFAFIRRVSLPDNPNPLMQVYAKNWLSSTTGLVKGASDVVTKEAERLRMEAELTAEQAEE